MKRLNKQSGSVIIIVLWTAVLLTVLVTAMAGKVRLSAQTAVHNRDASQDWAQLMTAVNLAEMELMLERMPPPIDQQLEESEEGELRLPAYSYDGEALKYYLKLLSNYIHNDTIIVLDDIRWSKSMFNAWNKIKLEKKYHLSMDFFRMAILMKRTQQAKEHFILKLKR